MVPMAGFLSELNRAAKIMAREHEKAMRAAEKERVAAARRAEQARKAEERATTQYERAAAAERKRLEKEAKAAHVAAKLAEVDERNLELEAIYEEADSLLGATLGVDDFVDLEALRVTVAHSPFDRADLKSPLPPPPPIPDPPEPVYRAPAAPTGISSLFGGAKKHAKAVEAATTRHQDAMADWKEELIRLEGERVAAVDKHERAEKNRLTMLQVETARYERECAAKEAEAAERNAAVDELIANLGYGVPEAVQEYVSIVLDNSLYPDHFPVTHEFSFEAATAELRLRVLVPPPDQVSDIKAYKYVKASDEISTTKLSQKACRDRYASAIHQVALRSIHEVFEADRRGLIQTVSLEVGTDTVHPATGQRGVIPFVAVASERAAFMEFDLSAVVPSATLEHLGAALSKDPYRLVASDTKGVRRA